MTLNARSQHPDHALRENSERRAAEGTHLAPDAPADALFVGRGSGGLGADQGALSVRAGSALLDGTEHTLATDAAIDIAGGDGDPRRDVVYLAPAGAMPDAEQQVTTGDGAALGVREGNPGALAWDAALDNNQQTITNAYRPAPPDFADTAGYPLAVVTVTANAGTLPSGGLTELRADAPASADRTQEFERVSTPGGRINGEWVLDPDVTDFGGAVNEIVAQMSAGEHLYIPPADYEAFSTGVLDIADTLIYGEGVGTGFGNEVYPRIIQQSDVPVLKIDSNNVTARGLNVFSGISNNDTSSGIVATGARTHIEDCSVRGFGKHGIHFQQPQGRTNNNSVVENTAVTHNDGDGVRVSRADGAAENNNAMRISLTSATKNAGWGINVPQWTMGNEYKILNYSGEFEDGTVNPNGAIRHAGVNSRATIIYSEGFDGDEIGIQFGGGGNYGEIQKAWDGSSYDKLYNDTATDPNYKWQYFLHDKPNFVGDRLSVGGTFSRENVGGTAVLQNNQQNTGGIEQITDLAATFDHGQFDAANNEFAITRPGTYLITGTVGYQQLPAGDYCQCKIGVNGTYYTTQPPISSTQGSPAVNNTTVQNLSAGDTVGLYGNTANGGTVRASEYTTISIAQIG